MHDDADLHYLMYLIAYFSWCFRSKIFETTTTVNETIKVPHNAVNTHVNFPQMVFGKTSP